MSSPRKFDPASVRKLSWDWAEWLASGDSLDAATVAASPSTGVSVGSPSITGAVVTAFVSAPGRTVGDVVRVTCHVVTDAGEEDDSTIILKLEEL